MATKRKQSADLIAAKRVLDAESRRRRHPAQATRLDDKRIDVPAIGSDRAEAGRKIFAGSPRGVDAAGIARHLGGSASAPRRRRNVVARRGGLIANLRNTL